MSANSHKPQVGACPPASSRAGGGAWTCVIPAVLILGSGLLLIGWVRPLGLLGWDTYPLILTSRVESWNDLAGTFTDKLMDGRYPGDFYRPLLNLSFALDYALWGLKPLGYHLTEVLLYVACAAALYRLARRAAGPASPLAPLAALVFFLLYPSHVEVLPVPARRPELLCGLFMLLALASQLSPRALSRRRPPVLPAVFTLLAIASKETAFVLPAIVFVALTLYTPQVAPGARLKRAALGIVPHLIAVAVMLTARFAVLGGLGGHAKTSIADALRRLPGCLIGIGQWLLLPQPAMQIGPAGAVLLAVLAGCLLLAILPPSPADSGGRATPGAHWGRASVLAGSWLLVVGLIYAAAGTAEPWYLFLPVVGLSVLVGAVFEWLWTLARTSSVVARVPAALALLALVALTGWDARYSPLLCRPEAWSRASAAADSFLGELQAAIAASPDGRTIEAPPMPIWIQRTPAGPQVLGGAVLADYSVQAWAELVFPQRRIRVRLFQHSADDWPTGDELLVVVDRRLPGS